MPRRIHRGCRPDRPSGYSSCQERRRPDGGTRCGSTGTRESHRPSRGLGPARSKVRSAFRCPPAGGSRYPQWPTAQRHWARTCFLHAGKQRRIEMRGQVSSPDGCAVSGRSADASSLTLSIGDHGTERQSRATENHSGSIPPRRTTRREFRPHGAAFAPGMRFGNLVGLNDPYFVVTDAKRWSMATACPH